MPETNKSVLTMTDLSARSDDAVRCAGSIAAIHGWQLHVVFALGRVGNTGDAGEVLGPVHEARLSADFAARAQLRRLLGDQASTLKPMLELAEPCEALLRAAAECRPALVVLPSGWGWQRGRWLSRHVLNRLGAPLLVTGRGHLGSTRRVVVALDPVHLDADMIKSASHWSFWFRDLVDIERQETVPELDFVFVEGGPFEVDFRELFGPEPTTLIIVPLESFAGSASPEEMDRMMTHLLTEMEAPILLVTRSQTPLTRLSQIEDEKNERRILA